ncbi:hypothetical protein [Kutzneria kofuensis]|uniref:hypothetical protein n=1 Tax=Kutzneria kofuensis TaxID=103725 RepID=UPI0031EB20AB
MTCSGAATSDLYKEYLGQPPQLDALRADTSVVLLTIWHQRHRLRGLRRPVHPGRLLGRADPGHRREAADMAKNLGQVVKDIHSRSPHARIVLSGYGSQLTAGPNASGAELDPICEPEVFSAEERTEGNALASQVDKTLQDTTSQAKADGIDTAFVSEYAADSVHLDDAFAGQSLCEAGTRRSIEASTRWRPARKGRTPCCI